MKITKGKGKKEKTNYAGARSKFIMIRKFIIQTFSSPRFSTGARFNRLPRRGERGTALIIHFFAGDEANLGSRGKKRKKERKKEKKKTRRKQRKKERKGEKKRKRRRRWRRRRRRGRGKEKKKKKEEEEKERKENAE